MSDQDYQDQEQKDQAARAEKRAQREDEDRPGTTLHGKVGSGGAGNLGEATPEPGPQH